MKEDRMTVDTNRALTRRVRSALPHLDARQARSLSGVLARLISMFRPERIYAFGSAVRGEATADSDVDLLVVISGADRPIHRLEQAAYEAAGSYLVPLDILVMTREEFERRAPALASLPATVLREGKELYAA